MRKYMPWFVVLLLVCSASVYQWLRADEKSSLLEARIHEVEKELVLVGKVESSLPAFEKHVRGKEYQLARMQKRLPPEPGTETFVAELISRCKENAMEVQLRSVKSRNKEFYTETEIIFVLSENVHEELKLAGILKNQERLVHWKFVDRDKELMVTIYNSPVDMKTSGVQPCRIPIQETSQYWPFNSSLEKKRQMLTLLCSSRDNKLQILEKAEHLRQTSHKLEVLTLIADELDRRSQQKEKLER